MKTRQVALSFIGLLFCLSLHAEYFKHIGQEDGLSQSSVMAIYQDVLGRMWFGTREGINVYDKEKITVYRGVISNGSHKNDGLVIGNDVSAITGHQCGDVFMIIDESLIKYDIHQDSFQRKREGAVYALTADDETVWAAFHDSIFSYDHSADELVFSYKTGLSSINYMKRVGSSFYIGTKTGLYLLTSGGVVKCLIPKIDVYRIFESSQKELWVGCRTQGLYRIDRAGRITQVPYSPSNHEGLSSLQIRDFVEDWNGNIWFGTFDGLQKYDPRTKRYSLINQTHNWGQLAHKSIFSLYQDAQGTIWVGSYYGGVNYFNPQNNSFTYYPYNPNKKDGLTYPFAGEMVEDKRGDLWICTDGGGLACLDRPTGKFETLVSGGENSLPHNNLKGICYDPDRDMLYIGTHLGGLARYDLRTKRFHNYMASYKRTGKGPCDVIFQVTYRQGALYVSARNGLFKLNPDTNEFELIRDRAYFISFAVAKNRTIWLATGTTLTCIDEDSKELITSVDLKKFGCQFPIGKLLLSNDGLLYAATLGSGVFCLNTLTKACTNYSLEQKQLLSNYCYNLVQTDKHQVLVTTDCGITFLDPSRKTERSIELQNGLLLSSIINGCGAYITRDRTLFIGGTSGIIAFKEKNLTLNEKAPKLYFSQLWVNNAEVSPGDETRILSASLPFLEELNLNASQNNITIEFASSNYMDILNGSGYEYKLEGLDEQWISTSQTRLSYTNLDPGTYVLHLRNRTNPLRHQKMQEIALCLVVHPYWYNTWWALLLFALLLLGATRWIYRMLMARKRLALSLKEERLEKQRTEEMNQAKLLFFTNVSHEFRTPLTLIIAQIEAVFQHQTMTEELRQAVLKINKQAKQMKNLVSELLDFRKFDQEHMVLNISEVDLAPFVKEVYEAFREYAANRHLIFTLEIPSEPVRVWADQRQLRKVLYNLLSNAFKYTSDNGEIGLHLACVEDGVVIRVTDNGAGIAAQEVERVFDCFYQATNKQRASEAHPGTGLGLTLSKSIVEKHGGTISVESTLGCGSCFTVQLKRDRLHLENRSDIAWADGALEPMCLLDVTTECQKEPQLIPDELMAQGLKNYTVLIVEDHVELLETLYALFIPFYNVVLAKNGEDGLQKMMEHQIDLVISDVMMPVMSGTEMCLQIKTNLDLCHVPVVLLTALDLVEQNIEGLGRGADDYITKPFEPRLLLARCNSLIRNRILLKNQFAKRPIEEIDLVAVNALDKEFLERVVAIIDAHIADEAFDIGVLCKEIGMGRTLLYSKFKALTGMTPNNFILNHKLKRAAALLKNNLSLQVADIAFSLGFGSPVYFSRCFKAQFKVAPIEYRKQSMR